MSTRHKTTDESCRELQDRASFCACCNDKSGPASGCGVPPFKAAIDTMANSDDYVRGKISACERRILFTKWVGQAWENILAKDMVIRSLKKCVISVAIDGSEDTEINIVGLEGYAIV